MKSIVEAMLEAGFSQEEIKAVMRELFEERSGNDEQI